MCPLFAPEGSPWTGEKDAPCPQKPAYDYSGPEVKELEGGCGFYQGFGGTGCDGCTGARDQADEAKENGRTFQIGPVRQQKENVIPKEFDCPRAKECQWQIESGDQLCPPRYALSIGVDPRACAW
jgi:hypothetical protein